MHADHAQAMKRALQLPDKDPEELMKDIKEDFSGKYFYYNLSY